MKLLLIDLSHCFWTQWHATADKEIGEAYKRTLEQVSRLAEGHELVAICIDSPPYWRKGLSAEYKAQRDTPEPAAVEQFKRIKDRLTADGRVMWAAPGYEADDIIAGACDWATAKGHEVTIASADKDLLQLVTDKVELFHTREWKRISVADVEAKFGVLPSQMRDLLAMWGDKADNVPGAPGVGPKKAAAMLAMFGDLDAIYHGIREAPESERNAAERSLLQHEREVYLARNLVSLKRDAAVDYEEVTRPRVVKPLIEDAEFAEESSPEAAAADFEELTRPADADKQWEESVGAVKRELEEQPEARAKKVTAIVKATEENWTLALEPNCAEAAWKVAQHLFNSRLYQAFPTQAAIFAVILRGRALGLDATTALANFHVVEGKPTMQASLIVGLVLNSGKAEYFDCTETTNQQATWETKRKGAKSPMVISFSIEDALAAGLVQKQGSEYRGVSRSGKPSNWDKYRRTMLRWRAATELARIAYPDVVAGLYTPDEISDGNDIGESAAE